MDLTPQIGYSKPIFFVRRSQIRGIIDKARIPVGESNGRVLLGVLDETGALNYGEVFIKISEDMGNTLGVTKVITSPVAVAKSPCLHPGKYLLCFHNQLIT